MPWPGNLPIDSVSAGRWRGLTVTKPRLVGLVALVMASALVVRNLAAYSWDPTIFVAFGEKATETLDYGRALLGDVTTRPELGHDGRFFFAQANDPLLLEPQRHAVVLDRPIYRAQRMLYPLLAGGFGLFPPSWVVWGMILVNVLALGLGSWATARYAELMGGSPWWGLAFVGNVGMLSEVMIGGAGVVGFALAMWGLVALREGKRGRAVGAITLAVLSREVYLIVAAGAAIWTWRRHRKSAIGLAVVPVIVAASWALYVRWRLSGIPVDPAEVREIGWPLIGLIRAAASWLHDPVDLMVGAAVVVLLVAATIRTLRDPSLLNLATVGFVPLAVLLTQRVWLSYFDITRAVAPLLTSWVLSAFAVPHRRRSELGV